MFGFFKGLNDADSRPSIVTVHLSYLSSFFFSFFFSGIIDFSLFNHVAQFSTIVPS